LIKVVAQTNGPFVVERKLEEAFAPSGRYTILEACERGREATEGRERWL
jgi:hypothetical protein